MGTACFNPRPSFLAGETSNPPRHRPRRRSFNPRPSFLAGETRYHGSELEHNFVSIHPRHFWRAKPAAQRHPAATVAVSIHARHFWRAKHAHRRPWLRRAAVSIHARHFWRAKHIAAMSSHQLQSVSIHARHFWRAKRQWRRHHEPPFGFNPRPSFLAGETSCPASAKPSASRFQSTPVISGGRNREAGRGQAATDVSIHARHFWRAKPRAWSAYTAHQAFQSTPVISGGRNPFVSPLAGPASGFNPRPSFLAGETKPVESLCAVVVVSIHARHFWRAKHREHAPCAADVWFQSTPVISGGRNRTLTDVQSDTILFQSTPVISGGRNAAVPSNVVTLIPVSIHARHFWRAKPVFGLRASGLKPVSIHARHFWRAKRTANQQAAEQTMFQSTPVISGGRNGLNFSRQCTTLRFNPRPSFLAGETRQSSGLVRDFPVSIHARHFWRAKPPFGPGEHHSLIVSIHARHFWRAKRFARKPLSCKAFPRHPREPLVAMGAPAVVC